MFVHRAGEDHFDDFDHGGVGHSEAVDELGFDFQALEHGVDLRAAAVHDDGVHADLLEQGDVLAEFGGEIGVAHGVTAVFHHDGRPGVAAQERERLRQDTGLLGGFGVLVGRGGHGAGG